MKYFVFAVFLLGLLPSNADASPLEMGEVGIFLDPAGTQRTAVIAPFATFDVYLVARIPAGGLDRYGLPTPEFSGSFTAMGLSGLPEETKFQLSVSLDTCPLAAPLDPSACPHEEGEIVALGRTTVLRAGFDVELCVEDFTCPTIGGPAIHSNQFSTCDEPTLTQEFVLSSFNCIRVDGTVATGLSSWSAVKGLYRQN